MFGGFGPVSGAMALRDGGRAAGLKAARPRTKALSGELFPDASMRLLAMGARRRQDGLLRAPNTPNIAIF